MSEYDDDEPEYPGGWFGESWGAAVCEEETHRATPVGQSCMADCGRPIDADDQGMIIPHMTADRGMMLTAYHKVCFLKGLGL